MILNLDLNKAYDRVNWKFVKKVLKVVGLPILWIHLIMECITSVTYLVIINGEPVAQINPKAGLRQGDLITIHFHSMHGGAFAEINPITGSGSNKRVKT